jgi:hypothetical protein
VISSPIARQRLEPGINDVITQTEVEVGSPQQAKSDVAQTQASSPFQRLTESFKDLNLNSGMVSGRSKIGHTTRAASFATTAKSFVPNGYRGLGDIQHMDFSNNPGLTASRWAPNTKPVTKGPLGSPDGLRSQTASLGSPISKNSVPLAIVSFPSHEFVSPNITSNIIAPTRTEETLTFRHPATGEMIEMTGRIKKVDSAIVSLSSLQENVKFPNFSSPPLDMELQRVSNELIGVDTSICAMKGSMPHNCGGLDRLATPKQLYSPTQHEGDIQAVLQARLDKSIAFRWDLMTVEDSNLVSTKPGFYNNSLK